jgi:amino acid transporter
MAPDLASSHVEPTLVRAIGVRRLAASVVNATVGAGIFVLPAAVAAEAGSAAPYAYLVCTTAMALVVTCFAAAGSRVTMTGGPYAYVETAFGRFAGFVAGVLFWLSAALAVASVAAALVGSVSVVWPVAAAGWPRTAILVLIFSSLAFANVRGVSIGALVIEILTVSKLLPLLALVFAGVWLGRIDTGSWLPLPAADQAGRGAVLLFFAFQGLEVALTPSGEVRDPSRTVPRALYLALAITATLYFLIQAVAQATLGESLAGHAAAPLAETAARLGGDVARTVVLAGAAVSMFGYVAGDMLGSPRVLFAFARDGLLPEAVGRVHPRFHTPWVAILLHAFIVCLLAVSSTFTRLVILTTLATLSLYLLCVLASYQLQRRDVRADGPPFQSPGGPAIPLLASAVIVWMLSQGTALEFGLQAVVLAAATVLYLLRMRRPLRE